MLAAISGILADHGVNIEGQLLGTRGEVGYVLTDIGCDYSTEVLDGLAGVDATIRLRLLS